MWGGCRGLVVVCVVVVVVFGCGVCGGGCRIVVVVYVVVVTGVRLWCK